MNRELKLTLRYPLSSYCQFSDGPGERLGQEIGDGRAHGNKG
jgi:hypothetical protein